ncbi:MAG: ATP-binding protein [Treponema sp.]|nr:ATP-binding protein [Treponema sp.]
MNDFNKNVLKKFPKLTHEHAEKIVKKLISDNDRYDSILESLSTGLAVVDKDWHLLQTNKAAERLIPLNPRILERKSDYYVWELIEDVDIASYLEGCAREMKSNVSEEFSVAVGDHFKFVTVSVLPLVEKISTADDVTKTEITGWVITADDVTEKRRSEILLHRMESLASLTNLAASVAHEIKNPLGAISIHIQLLQKAVSKSRAGDGMLPKEKFMEDYISVINEEIDSLNKIVVNFLVAVRPVQANMQLASPDSLIESFADFFRPEFESKKITLETKLKKSSVRVLLDEKLFREVLINLAQNAIAALESKKKKNDEADFSASVLIESAFSDDKYKLIFSDNGCGMDDETTSRIFEPYYTTKATGTGLGMTMVYKIIKEFQGDISVKSELGKGTVFTITLPIPQKNVMLLEDNSGGREDEKA